MCWKDVRIDDLEAEVVRLREENAELKRRLALDSANSSKPPSSDGLKKAVRRARSLREVSGKASGGQAGHKGETLKQVAHPDAVERHDVKECAGCGADLSRVTAEVVTRQVFDIPAPRVIVTEHRAEVKRCTCGRINRGVFPSEATSQACYGTQVRALASYLSVWQLIPEDRLSELFSDVLGLPITPATIATINRENAAILGPHQEQVLATLKEAKVKHLDESGLRVTGKTRWLHVISNDQQTHYRVREKRGDLLEGLKNILVHDHWKPYFTIEGVEHAMCNAHHLRELKALAEIEKESWASRMTALLLGALNSPDPPVARILALYDRIIAKGLAFHEAQPPLSSRKNKRRTGHNLLLRLQKHKEDTLRFLTDPDVPFTNNQAERDVRMVKVKQKISGSFRSGHGAHSFCTLRGFLSTHKKQGHRPLTAIAHAIA